MGPKDKEFRTSAGLDLFATFLTVVKYLCHDVSRDHIRCTVQWYAAPGKSGLHARGEGERVMALEYMAFSFPIFNPLLM